MTTATEANAFDVGPLTWIRGEVDLALERADQALQQCSASLAAGAPDLTQIKFGRTHLHQVQGALTIVGLDGVTQFASAVEELLQAIEQEKVAADDALIGLAQRALAAIGVYLDDLVNGQPNQPLRLLPLYREVQAARGIANVLAADLFFPDLTARPPRRSVPTRLITASDLQRLLRQERARFERGFLAWLRNSQQRSGVIDMMHAVRRIEATQDAPAARAFWWIAGAFLAALAEDALADDKGAKHLCVRIDLQIRRLLEGSKNVAERLQRDALYFVAQATSHNEAVDLVKATYHLAASLPSAETAAAAPKEAIRRKLRDVIGLAEEAWNKYCAGTAQSLPVFRENANALTGVVEQLGQTDFKRLAQAIAAAANWLAEDAASRHGDALAMEIATAILLAQNAQENFSRLGSDFAHQVDVTVARIHGCIAGTPPQPGSEIPLLDAMSRQAQEKLLIGQVAKEIQTNLVQIEQVLDAFFRDPDKRHDLAPLEPALNQVAGALSIMRHDGAVAAVKQCAAEIKRFADAAYAPQEGDFERVASELSLLGFFVDSLPHGGVDFERFVKQMQPAETTPEEAAAVSVEQEVAQQKLETHALLGALQDKPDDARLREEVKNNLVALQNDADLVADAALGEQAKAMLSALGSGEDAAPQIAAAMSTFKPSLPESLKPSAETMQLAQASNEEIDAELLEIFLEEAGEVLATIADSRRVLHEQPHSSELLTTIRRAFHTLKGSGRMVGLRELGEAAWSVEQTLNLWLRQEFAVNAAIFELVDVAHQLFADWVEQLEAKSGTAPDTSAMVALAEALRRGSEDDAAQPEAAAFAAPAPVAETVVVDPPPAVETQASATDAVPAVTEVDFPDLDLAAEATDAPPEPPSVSAPPATYPGESAQTITTISPVLFEIFFEEARVHLLTLQRELPQLEADEQAPTPHDMYRAAHTLAGISATVGIRPVNQLGSALERALLRRDHAPQAGSFEALGVLREAVGEIDLMLWALAEQRAPVPRPALIEALDALYPVSVAAPTPVGEPATEVTEIAETPTSIVPQASAPGPRSEIALTPIDDEIDEQLLPIFLDEALDLNVAITTGLRSWRSAPADAETVRTLTRLLHTLKGSARMAGAMNLGEITHAIETRVEEASRSGSAPGEVIDEIADAFDAVLQIIERLQRGESVAPTSEATATDATPDATIDEFPDARSPIDERRAERAPPTAEGEPAAQRATLRVRADTIDRLVNEAGELSIARARIEGEMRSLKGSLLDLTENVIRLRRQLRDIEIQAESQMQSRTALADEKHAGFDPLEFDRFTRFQELTRMMAESVNDVGTVQQNLLKNLDDANAAIIAQARLNREVQQALMAVRMVPFGSVADRLYRIARQTSKELGKRANLEISGHQVELDRSVLDKMGPPLEHMLRNAIAHGLEDRDTRVAQGKPDIGEISLTLKQEGNEILLTLADDGKGLDFDRIRARAIETGLIAATETADPARLAELIFAPGFTTASEVSRVAGRGVGMDVVKTEVTSLGGRIETSSTPGQGTEFRLYIPLTLAVTKALLVRVGSKRYAIPSVMIEQVLDIKEAALTEIRDRGTARWLENAYPFNYLPHLLGDTQALPEKRRQYWVLLLRSGKRRIAVQVDELMGNKEIVVKNIGPQLARVIGVDGATVLGDGQVVLILNPIALASRTPITNFATPVPRAPQLSDEDTARSRLPTVMVVDDSLTVRKITGRLLSREGYHVITAKDGVEALEILLDVIPDVMLVDIEMPRLDGFDLTRNVRSDARLQAIPIIMITSRSADKHRRYALEVGVNDYLGKPYQEDELLRLVAGYVAATRLAVTSA